MKLSEAVAWCKANHARVHFYNAVQGHGVLVEVPVSGLCTRTRRKGSTLVRAVIAVRQELGRRGRCDECGNPR